MDTRPIPETAAPIPEPSPVVPTPAINTGSQPQNQPKADRPLDDNTVSSGGVPPAPPPPKLTMPIVIAIIVTAFVVSGIFYGISRITAKQTVVAPVPTATPMPTPTPIRQPSAIASDSAFIEFRIMVATLSAAIAGFSPQDPSLTPPTLNLPLGFSR